MFKVTDRVDKKWLQIWAVKVSQPCNKSVEWNRSIKRLVYAGTSRRRTTHFIKLRSFCQRQSSPVKYQRHMSRVEFWAAKRLYDPIQRREGFLVCTCTWNENAKRFYCMFHRIWNVWYLNLIFRIDLPALKQYRSNGVSSNRKIGEGARRKISDRGGT